MDKLLESKLFRELCSLKNLHAAFKKSRKGKGAKPSIAAFEKSLDSELRSLRTELLLKSYTPQPLRTFVVKDPKTRTISASAFRDRVIHHALCNIIEPLFDKTFIHDSFANRKGKGTLAALQRFDYFKRKVSRNNTWRCFVLKADIRHYFKTVDQKILLEILCKIISDAEILWLIRKIVGNYSNASKGMPLGNLTSQFFANVYLNELDQFVKHVLKARYYIRYVDDFVILHDDRKELKRFKEKINLFLNNALNIELHPDKSKIIPLEKGISFLGFRVFYYHKLLKKSNIRNMKGKFKRLVAACKKGTIDYDAVYDSCEGWMAYAHHANTYKLRKRVAEELKKHFPHEVSTKELNRMEK